MSYATMRFEDLPNETTPINASNLNNMLEGIDELFEALAEKLDVIVKEYSSEVFNNNTSPGVFYQTTNAGTTYLFFCLEPASVTSKTQFRFSKNGLEKRTSINSAWDSWRCPLSGNSIATSHIQNAAVTKEKLSIALQQFVEMGYICKSSTVNEVSTLEGMNSHPCIYLLTLNWNCATAFGVPVGTRAIMITLGDWNTSITRWMKIIGKGIEFTQEITISGDTYTYGSWAKSPQNIQYDDIPTELIDDIGTRVFYDEVEISAMSDLNSPEYASPYQKYGVLFTGAAAVTASVSEGTIGELTTVEVSGTIKRYITFPEINGLKLCQNVNSVAPTWSADNWVKLN